MTADAAKSHKFLVGMGQMVLLAFVMAGCDKQWAQQVFPSCPRNCYRLVTAGSASPKKRKRSSPAKEASASAASASDSEVEANSGAETSDRPKKKAVLKYKAPTTKASCLLIPA